MDDYLALFVDTDRVAYLLSRLPSPLIPYLLAVVELNEITQPLGVGELLAGVLPSDNPQIPRDEFGEILDPTSNKEVMKQLAKIDGVQEKIEERHSRSLKTYAQFFNPLRELLPVNDMALIRQFGNAPSLASAFGADELTDGPLVLLPSFSIQSQHTLHAALACQMAGLSKPAQLLFDDFLNQKLVESNHSYQSFQQTLLKYINLNEAAASAGKSGRNKRHGKSDKVKAFALERYVKGNFKNPHQASQILVADVAEYGKSLGYRFSSDYQAPRTIETWIRKYLSEQHTK
ncbi:MULTISPECIES: hypothetical protein [Shewanella]|uniref:hypothetical protein n=1 Tax=Shewanella TaxID=22 RepID=UPI0011847E52|nr:hypothetical protein [Shewanella sp. MSW]TVP08617.1 hypothetical protein AYI96_19305 [Shewanella sp. MSW]